MMTTNKLTKTFASGFATLSIAAVAGIVNAPSAGAVHFVGNVFDATIASRTTILFQGQEYDSVRVGDKKFYDFDFFSLLDNNETNGVKIGDKISIFNTGSSWAFEYDYEQLPAGDTIGLPFGQIKYGVHIVDDPETPLVDEATANLYFNTIDFDTEITGTPDDYLATKKVYDSNDVLKLTLESLNGASDSGSILSHNLKTIKVIDTFTQIAPTALLLGSNNDFTQSTHVPEPGTILGLLTVGGLGLVSRFKKQK